MKREQEVFGRLLEIMGELRTKCPWDKKQTLESLRHLTIEETYELSDAILKKDMEGLKGELGDLLLHVVFYSKITSESFGFGIADVVETINEKLIRRHPHIYGDVRAEDAEQVKNNWEKIKQKEGRKSVLDGVPSSLPSLLKSFRMQEKASGVGFDWDDKSQVWNKVVEEIDEFKCEIENIDNNNIQKIEEEFGDLLFSLVNYARFINVNPEDALEKTNRKFERRFLYIENKSKLLNKSIESMSVDELNYLWDEAKMME